ncbi:TusE/DsrC/DsvC family sulfur relay protein [uncultured Thiohalocapsa sp.]|uniref:TusE/DsrC/DsvC family sulfur relay protein n=1 Tax=uncultured Thiohalocapsa sp. TaxID=768990 RepID=UPI0025D57055|nr:TusE/DsrC/DsvC family sulfur relay protein [uncultured Thiohalocapsa sp.]
MTDIKQVIQNPDTSSPVQADRERDLADWNPAQAKEQAAELGISLTDDHWAVIDALREHYRQHGLADDGRELGDMLDERFADAGGRRWLRKLFPEGPVLQGMQIAGLPVPPHTEDEGFGTAR